jgi:hypothetical protein
MSRQNISSTHPIISNSQEYMYEKKYVSIHSEDRDYIRFPNSNEFEVMLPQDICNVESVRLTQWTFPANYDTFSIIKNNLILTFKITEPYNPGDPYHMATDPLLQVIFQALYQNIDNVYVSVIEQGFYTPQQMAAELTNRLNQTVTTTILTYFTTQTEEELPNKTALLNEFIDQGGYNQFVVAYNEVGQKLWFGNKSSDFIITNSNISVASQTISTIQCNKTTLPDFSNWGLSDYLGFFKCDATTTPGVTINNLNILNSLPRFFYGDYKDGDNGYWLVPDSQYTGATVYYLETPKKINVMGDAYFYLEINGMNNIDETSPFGLSPFTIQTNGTNGIVNSSFAKIAVPTTPLSQWFDNGMDNYKWYNPPAERIRRIRLKLRYHNGAAVDFGDFNFSITLEFNVFNPQISRKVNLYTPNI